MPNPCSGDFKTNLNLLQVDNNVTRHIANELEASDWDVMILHYLGLDHIGHTVGPSSSLVPPKLQEMDSVVETVYNGLKQKVGLPFVLVTFFLNKKCKCNDWLKIFLCSRHSKNGGGALSFTPVRACVRASVRYQNLVSAQ